MLANPNLTRNSVAGCQQALKQALDSLVSAAEALPESSPNILHGYVRTSREFIARAISLASDPGVLHDQAPVLAKTKLPQPTNVAGGN